MKLRQQLQTLGYSHSFTTEEKGAFKRKLPSSCGCASVRVPLA